MPSSRWGGALAPHAGSRSPLLCAESRPHAVRPWHQEGLEPWLGHYGRGYALDDWLNDQKDR